MIGETKSCQPPNYILLALRECESLTIAQRVIAPIEKASAVFCWPRPLINRP